MSVAQELPTAQIDGLRFATTLDPSSHSDSYALRVVGCYHVLAE